VFWFINHYETYCERSGIPDRPAAVLVTICPLGGRYLLRR
jgi:hypothetical protein